MRRILALTTGRIAVVILAIVALLALLGPLLAPQDPWRRAVTPSPPPPGSTGWAPTTSAVTCSADSSTGPGSASSARSKSP